MSRPDEGLIHTWLDGELDAEEAARVEKLVATDPEWAAAAAEARGLIAASSRIVGKLDVVAGDVIPKGSSAAPVTMKRRAVPTWMRIAAGLVLVAGVGYVATNATQDGVATAVSEQVAAQRSAEASATTGLATTTENAPSPPLTSPDASPAAAAAAAPTANSAFAVRPRIPAAPQRRDAQDAAAGAGPIGGNAAGSVSAVAVAPEDRAAVERQAREAELERAKKSTAEQAEVRDRADLERSRLAIAQRAPSASGEPASRGGVATTAVPSVSQPTAKAATTAAAPPPATALTSAPAAAVQAAPAANADEFIGTRVRTMSEVQIPQLSGTVTPPGTVLAGCWRVTTAARVDTLQKSPPIVRTSGDTLTLMLRPSGSIALIVRSGDDEFVGKMWTRNTEEIQLRGVRRSCEP